MTTLEIRVWRSVWPSWHEDETEAALRQFAAAPPGAVTLFGRHLPDLQATVALNTRILNVTAGETRIAVDEEGGPVRRLPYPFPAFPAAAVWAATTAPEVLQVHAADLGRRLRALGFAIDFAPVADLELLPEHPALRDRCYGSDPNHAARCVAAVARGLVSAGLNACVKHFPGHGAVPADSHVDLATLDADLETVRRREWLTFRAGLAAGAGMVMTGHFVWPAVDPKGPTTFSSALIRLLRHELGFGGVIISDDVEMGALAKRWPPDEAALLALAAGHDAVLLCHRFETACQAVATIVREAERSPALRAHLEAAAARIARLYQVSALPDANAVAAASAPSNWPVQ